MKLLDHPDTREAIRRYTIAGIAVVIFLTGGVGVWAGTMHIAGALIAPGTIVVDSNVKKVQHPTGGVVGEVRVHDGDHVKAGDLLVRLDDTVARASLAIVTKGLTEFEARRARLAAERDRADTIKFPDGLLQRENDPDVAQVLAAERKLFDLRRAARAGQKAQLRERIEQLGKEINGFTSQQISKEKEVTLIQHELEGVHELFQKNLVPMTRVTALERDATRLDGERGQLVASIAQAKGKVAELNLQIIQVDEDASSEVAKEMREVEGKIGEFVERKIAAADQLKRTDIRAPQAGTVFQSTVHTVGGVIPPGDPMMIIVPDAENLAVEARVNPQDIDKVQVTQPAVLRFSAFDTRTTPEIFGKVTRVSADTTLDQRTGQSYYTIRIALERDQMERLGNVRLVPGMPVDAFVQTGERTVIAYLMKPLSDQIVKAFREK
jgi:HlyD family secretion protein